jgi:hypothetical protein
MNGATLGGGAQAGEPEAGLPPSPAALTCRGDVLTEKGAAESPSRIETTAGTQQKRRDDRKNCATLAYWLQLGPMRSSSDMQQLQGVAAHRRCWADGLGVVHCE